MRAVLSAWQADNGAHLAKAYLERSKQYVDWMERFDPQVTPAAVDEKWAKRYTAFLVRNTPLFNSTIHRHLNMLCNLVAYAGLPTKFIKNGFAHEAKKCYLTWEEVQQHHAWQAPALQPALLRQKDVFVARCLCGLRCSNMVALLRLHIKAGSQVNYIALDQQKTCAAVQIPIVGLLQEILDKYHDWPTGQALPVISRQQTVASLGSYCAKPASTRLSCGCATRVRASTKRFCPSGRLPPPTPPATPTGPCWPR